MNDHLILTELAEYLADVSGLATLIPNMLPAQSGLGTERPLLTISGDWKSYSITRRKGTLTLELRHRVGDETEAQHQTAFEALHIALMGAQGADAAASKAALAAAKAALKSALATAGNVTVTDYGYAENAIVANVEGDDLVTTLTLVMVWQFTPQV